MKNFISFTLSLLLIGLIASANADIIKIYPSDDMYSDPDHSGAHSINELWVANYSPAGHYQRIMIKFNLSQIGGYTINSASLNLYRFFGCPGGDPTSVSIYEIVQDWNESSWPPDQHISHGTTIRKSYVFSANGWHNIDITTLVQAWQDSSINNYGLVIEALSNNKFTKCYTKEVSNQSLRPYLEVDYNTVGIIEQKRGQIAESFLEAYPNPFNLSTQINFRIISREYVTLSVYNILGQKAAELQKRFLTAGNYSVTFDASNLPSGVYFVLLHAGERITTKKIMLIK